MTAPYRSERYVASKDGATQALIVLDDDLHLLTWGRLLTSNKPIAGAKLVTVANPEAWIRGQRALPVEPVAAPASPFSARYFDAPQERRAA